MQIEVPASTGEPIRFECADTWISRWVAEPILRGTTYPYLEFIDDVQVVVDAGANCGAATVHLARHYPEARVHAIEPAAAPRSYLERNVAELPNVSVHPVGLSDVDATTYLYGGLEDSITASVERRDVNSDETEVVEIRAAARWAAGQGIDRIDVMKLDVEGCEVKVLQSLIDLVPTIKVLYVEYDSRVARREIDALLAPTHELYLSMMMALDQGECIYIRNDLADEVDPAEELRKALAGGAPQG